MAVTNFKQVNWKQGMSVSSSHFIAMENFLQERIMLNSSFLQKSFSYGLMPELGEDPQMQLSIVRNNEFSRLVLYSYHGVTKGGYVIDYDAQDESVSCDCNVDAGLQNEGWDVVLSVMPFERRPCGEPNVQENPPRYPYVDPMYRLSIVARDHAYVNQYGPFDLVIGYLRKNDTTFKLEGTYIPPCMTMDSCEELRSCMKAFNRMIDSIDKSLSVIFEKAYAQKKNETQLMIDLLEIFKELRRGMARISFNWRNQGSTLSPYEVVEAIASLANAITASLTFLPKNQKEDVLKYFHEWNGIQPSIFEMNLSELGRNKFEQNRIATSIELVDTALKMLDSLLAKLSQLDYMGQHSDGGIVVGATNQKDSSNKSTSWSLVD